MNFGTFDGTLSSKVEECHCLSLSTCKWKLVSYVGNGRVIILSFTMSFGDLPDNAMLSIMLASDYKSILKMKVVSKTWLSLIYPNREFWREKFEMDFGEVDDSHVDFQEEYKLEYALRFREPRVTMLPRDTICVMDVQVYQSIMVSGGSCVRVWDLESMECVRRIETKDVANSVALDGVHVIAGLGNGDICVWSLDNVDYFHVWKTYHRVLVVRLCQDRVVSLGWVDEMKVWDMSTSECVQTLRMEGLWIHDVLGNGEVLINMNDALHVRHVEDGLLYTFEIYEPFQDASGNSKYVFVAFSTGEIQVWEKGTKEHVANLKGVDVEGYIRLICDERHVILFARGGHIKIWVVGDWTCIREFHLDVGNIPSVDYQRGKVVLGAAYGTIHVVDFGC